MLADDLGHRKIGIVQRIARVDDGLFGRVVKSLCLVHVAARADAGLLARLGLVQQRAERFALSDVGGKLIGCGVAARLNGFSRHDSIVIGTLMNTRGLTELVILSVGQSLGVLSDRTFAMMVIMALVTTFMAAPIINRLIPRRRMVH